MAKTKAPPELKICDDCGKEGLVGSNGLRMHLMMHCPANPDRKLPTGTTRGDKQPVRRSKRGMQLSGQTDRPPAMLDQIPQHPGGAWAYYIHPEGATIQEALSAYPNGGGKGTKFGKNADFYQSRQLRKGFEYVGSQLTTEGIKRLIEVISENRPDYLLFLTEKIAESAHDINDVSGLTSEQRDKQRTRKRQFEGQQRLTKQDLDGAYLTRQLTDIANAQALAQSFNPKQPM